MSHSRDYLVFFSSLVQSHDVQLSSSHGTHKLVTNILRHAKNVVFADLTRK